MKPGWRLFVFILFLVTDSVLAETVRDSASQALLDRAGALYEKGDWAGSSKLYRQAAHEGIDPAVSWFNYGNCQAQLKKMGEAAAAWTRALEWAPRFLRARQNLAILAEDGQDWGEAARQWRILWDIDSSDPDPANRLGEISLESAGPAEAVEWFQRARAVDSTASTANFGLARAYLAASDTESAVEVLDRFRLMMTEDTTGRLELGLGSLYESAHSWSRAEACYQDALAMKPKNEQAWLRLARLSQLRRRDDEAVVILRQALDQLPESTLLWKGLGQAGARAGDARTAVDGYARALQLGDKTAKTGLRTLSGWLRARGEKALAARADSLSAP